MRPFPWLKRMRGGYLFGRLEGAPSRRIEDISLPDKVIIPLRQGFFAETQCLVKKGERVKAGQIIGRDDHTYSSPVHATISGTVEGFETFIEGGEPHHGVIIRRDYDEEEGYVMLPGAGSAEKTPEEISEILYLGGVTSLGACGIPSLRHTSLLAMNAVKALVIKGINTEPFSLPADPLLSGRVEDFFAGIDILSRLFNLSENIHLAFDRSAALINEILSYSGERDFSINISSLKPVYPLDMEELLIEEVLRIRVPDECTPSDVGVVVLDVQDVLHVFDAVVKGKPVMERVIALGGPGYSESHLVRVRVGTPMENLLLGRLKDGIEHRILIGGAMRGIPIESPAHPVERTCTALTALAVDRERDFFYFIKPGLSALSYSRAYLSFLFPWLRRKALTNMQGEERPCIYCGYCEEVCPRGLSPHLYYKLVNHNLAADTLKYGLLSCVECALCSFVCPSKLELLETIKKGKKILGRDRRQISPAGMRKLQQENAIERSDSQGS